MRGARSFCRSALVAVTLAGSFAAAHPSLAEAQELQDVVYLKDGSIIRGTIVEQVPGESILIQTVDGNRFRYVLEDIDRMAKEAATGGRTEPEVTQIVLRTSKSPGTAWALSFLVPGGGQFYNGDSSGGFWFLFRQLIFTAAVVEQSNCVGSGCNGELITLWASAVVLNWIWSQVDAYQGAKTMNARSSPSSSPGLGFSFAPNITPRHFNTPFGNMHSFDVQIGKWVF